MNDSLLIETGRLERERVPVSGAGDKSKEPVEINMPFSDGQHLQVAPVHISAAIVIHVVMADMTVLPQPCVFLFVDQLQLPVKVRHLRIKDEVDIRIGFLEFQPVGHGVFQADYVLYQ